MHVFQPHELKCAPPGRQCSPGDLLQTNDIRVARGHCNRLVD
jgi:hypothetical protein